MHEAIREDPTPAEKKPWDGDRNAKRKEKKLTYVSRRNHRHARGLIWFVYGVCVHTRLFHRLLSSLTSSHSSPALQILQEERKARVAEKKAALEAAKGDMEE